MVRLCCRICYGSFRPGRIIPEKGEVFEEWRHCGDDGYLINDDV